jgi:hypothetical protein
MAARLRGRYFYGWLIVGVTFLTLLAASGGRAVPSVLILPLEHDFGWSRAVVALAVSINLLLFGLCGPFAAAVMERIGMRALMLVALLVMGLGAGALSGWVAATVANRWFGARRGLGDRGGGLAAGRAAGGGAGAGPPAPGRLRHPRLPAAHWAPALRGTATRGRDDATARRAGQPLRCRAPYAAGGGLLHLRGEHQRADWHAPDPVLGRARHDRGGGGESACDDRGLRYCRHDRLGLALGSVGQSLAAGLVLRAARVGAAVPPQRLRHRLLRTRHLRGLLRPRLGRDRAADGAPGRRHLWPSARRAGLRLALRRASARPGSCTTGSATTALRSSPRGLSAWWRRAWRSALDARCGPWAARPWSSPNWRGRWTTSETAWGVLLNPRAPRPVFAGRKQRWRCASLACWASWPASRALVLPGEGWWPPVLSRHVVACSLVWRVGSLTSGKHADRHAPHQ